MRLVLCSGARLVPVPVYDCDICCVVPSRPVRLRIGPEFESLLCARIALYSLLRWATVRRDEKTACPPRAGSVHRGVAEGLFADGRITREQYEAGHRSTEAIGRAYRGRADRYRGVDRARSC